MERAPFRRRPFAFEYPDPHANAADTYPGCFQDDIIALEAPDASVPQPGWLHFYLVTAEDFNFETSLGANSAGAERPNMSSCP